MRPEKLEKVEAVVYVLGKDIYSLNSINTDNPLRAEIELKRQERQAVDEIRRLQKEQNKNENGYFISAGIVYKVYFTSLSVKKITGEEAKVIRRLVKKEMTKTEALAA